MSPVEELVLIVSEVEARLIVAALDSHQYWQLADRQYRDSGYVTAPGSDDANTAAEIKAIEALAERIEQAIGKAPVRQEKGAEEQWTGSS